MIMDDFSAYSVKVSSTYLYILSYEKVEVERPERFVIL